MTITKILPKTLMGLTVAVATLSMVVAPSVSAKTTFSSKVKAGSTGNSYVYVNGNGFSGVETGAGVESRIKLGKDKNETAGQTGFLGEIQISGSGEGEQSGDSKVEAELSASKSSDKKKEKKVDNKLYSIKLQERKDNWCFDIPKAVGYPSQKVQLWDCNKTAGQGFSLEKSRKNDYFKLKHAYSGFCVSYEKDFGNKPSAGKGLVLDHCYSAPYFSLRYNSNGTTSLEVINRRKHTDYCVKHEGSVKKGTKLALAKCKVSHSQAFGAYKHY